MRVEIWAKQTKEELEKIDLSYIWQNQHESNSNILDIVTKEQCNYIERQNLFCIMCGKISLALHQEKKHTRYTEDYTEWCTGNARNVITQMKAGIAKLRG
jgi:hypothetical protein